MFIELLKAFAIGGTLCGICQLLMDSFAFTPAKILVGLFILGASLSAFGLYQPIVDFAGAGATVPLPGFGHLMMQGVMDAVKSDGITGALTGGLTAASAGLCSSVFFSCIAATFAHSHQPE